MTMARIAIIGTGRMATGLGVGWARAGHEVVFGSRTPEKPSGRAAAIEGTRIVGYGEALDGAEVIVITLPFTAVEGFAAQHAAALRGRLVIDISNPFNHLPDNRTSAPEITAKAIGPGARVAAAFKTNFAETLLDPVDAGGVARDVFFVSDSEADAEIVKGLIESLGFRAVDCGPLKNARVLDGMVPLLVELDARYGGRRKSSWKLLL